MRSHVMYNTLAAPMLVAGALLLGCDGAGDKLAPTGTDGAGGLQADLLGTPPPAPNTDWITRALLFPDLTADDARVDSWVDVAEADADDPKPYKVDPFEFDPYKTRLVRARWLHGSGCPTDATINTGSGPTPYSDPACPSGMGDPKDKRNEGLLLVKTGPTGNIASAGAEIKGVKGITLTELGYDIRAGSHCGAGAPRFNVTLMDGSTRFVGCSTGIGTPQPSASPTPTVGWDRLRWGAGGVIPAFPTDIMPTDVVKSISILYDEGQDTPFASGEAFLDNIDINGALTGRGPGN